jgi:hypothetical protein
MKITISEVLNGKQVLEKLVDKEVSIKVAYRLSRIIKVLNEELQLFEEQRQKLVQKYGTQQEDAPEGSITVSEENLEPFQKDLSELLTAEIDLGCEPMNIDEFGDNVEIKTAELMMIEKFIAG